MTTNTNRPSHLTIVGRGAPRPTRPEHTVACTDALVLRVLSEVRTARDLRVASSALREAAEQREDLGLDGAPAYRAAYDTCRAHSFRTDRRGRTQPATARGVAVGVAAVRAVLAAAWLTQGGAS